MDNLCLYALTSDLRFLPFRCIGFFCLLALSYIAPTETCYGFCARALLSHPLFWRWDPDPNPYAFNTCRDGVRRAGGPSSSKSGRMPHQHTRHLPLGAGGSWSAHGVWPRYRTLWGTDPSLALLSFRSLYGSLLLLTLFGWYRLGWKTLRAVLPGVSAGWLRQPTLGRWWGCGGPALCTGTVRRHVGRNTVGALVAAASQAFGRYRSVRHQLSRDPCRMPYLDGTGMP